MTQAIDAAPAGRPPAARASFHRRRVVPSLLALPLLGAATVWAVLAIWIDGPAPPPVAGALASGFVLTVVGTLLAVRPPRRAALLVVVAWLLVLGWWLRIPARNDRPWQPDVARLATASFEGDRVTVHNVRNFAYRSATDYTARWEDRTLDLARVRGVDLFLSYWGPTLIAHTILSWEFADGQHLAVSIETRKEQGESYSAFRGFFRQFEVYYVVADERDVVRLRTDFRGEQVFLYRLRADPDLARALLRSYLDEVNRLASTPRWYNAATHNCTTTIRFHVRQSGVQNSLDWRLLVNGRLDRLLFERGTIDTSLPFEEVRARSDVTAAARAAGDDADFSRLIRAAVRPRPGQS